MLDRVLKVCLAKVPEDRWQSARDLLRELRWTAEADARQSSSKARHSIKWMATTFVLLAGSIVLLGVYLVWTREALRFRAFFKSSRPREPKSGLRSEVDSVSLAVFDELLSGQGVVV